MPIADNQYIYRHYDTSGIIISVKWEGCRVVTLWKEGEQVDACTEDMMSSEQSGEEGDEPVILVKPLLWRGEQVNKLFRQLEQKIAAERTPQARCQLMCRVVASEPSRTAPVEDNLPPWLFH